MSVRDLLIEALIQYRVEHDPALDGEWPDDTWQLWQYEDHAEEFYGTPAELVDGLLRTDAGRTLKMTWEAVAE